MELHRVPHRLLISLIAGALLTLPGSAAAATRYADDAGSAGNAPCTDEMQPCDLTTAVNEAATGEEVVVDSGDYALTGGTFSIQKNITLRGKFGGAAKPRLTANSGSYTIEVFTGFTNVVLRDLRIEMSGTGNTALQLRDGTAERLELVSTGTTPNSAAFVAGAALLRDSVAWCQCASLGFGLRMGGVSPKLRNVTAVATGAQSSGIRAGEFGGETVDVKNTIAKGVASDIEVFTPATVNISYSNYDLPIGDGTVNDLGNNQTVLPQFVDELNGDFHQAPTSMATIDLGTADVSNGSLDLDGQLRSIGAAPDIGADEYLPPAPAPPLQPPAASPGASATGQRAAALKRCKKKKTSSARKKCKKKAKKLPL